jgi:nucleotide-binding universal stress UspA family protein
MSIRTILCPFTEAADAPAIRMALAVARDLQAHVAGMYIEPEVRHTAPTTYIPASAVVGAGYTRSPSAPVHDPYAEAARARDQAAATAKAHFEQLCTEHEVRFLGADGPKPNGDHTLPSASLERKPGPLADAITQHAHACDMVVTESSSVAKQAKPARAAIDAALLQAGRPVLLAPAMPPRHINGRILVAWKDTPPSWHALSQALPFMAQAEDVTLLHAGKGHSERLSAEAAADYLAWHGIQATVVQHEPGPTGVADYLMSQCSERHVDLMVMGAYSHSPLRERLLGGVTDTVVTHVAATPVLMTH